MTNSNQRFFLFIGSIASEAATSSLKASGIYYRTKRLESRPENWGQILTHLKDPDLIGVIAKLTRPNYEALVKPTYQEVGLRLLASLGKVRHILFVHETVLRGPRSTTLPGRMRRTCAGSCW